MKRDTMKGDARWILRFIRTCITLGIILLCLWLLSTILWDLSGGSRATDEFERELKRANDLRKR